MATHWLLLYAEKDKNHTNDHLSIHIFTVSSQANANSILLYAYGTKWT